MRFNPQRHLLPDAVKFTMPAHPGHGTGKNFRCGKWGRRGQTGAKRRTRTGRRGQAGVDQVGTSRCQAEQVGTRRRGPLQQVASQPPIVVGT